MTNRWFSRIFQGDHTLGSIAVARLPVRGVLASDFKYVEDKDKLMGIVIDPKAWKLDSKTWYRSDIRQGIGHIVGTVVNQLPVQTFIVWTCMSELYTEGKCLRVMDAEQARKESTLLWHWIAKVTQQTIRLQKKGGLIKEIDKWIKTRGKLLMPGSPS